MKTAQHHIGEIIKNGKYLGSKKRMYLLCSDVIKAMEDYANEVAFNAVQQCIETVSEWETNTDRVKVMKEIQSPFKNNK